MESHLWRLWWQGNHLGFRFVWFLCVKLTPKSNWWPPLSLLLMAMKQLQRNPFEDLTKPTSFYKTLLYNLQGLWFDSRENWQQSGGFLYPKCLAFPTESGKCFGNTMTSCFQGRSHITSLRQIVSSANIGSFEPDATLDMLVYKKNVRNNLRLELHWSLAIPCVVIAVHVPFQGVLKLVKSLLPFCSHRHPAASS